MDRYLKNIPENDGFDRKRDWTASWYKGYLPKYAALPSSCLLCFLSLTKAKWKGVLVKVLDSFSDLSDFEESRCALRAKAQELNLYDYTV